MVEDLLAEFRTSCTVRQTAGSGLAVPGGENGRTVVENRRARLWLRILPTFFLTKPLAGYRPHRGRRIARELVKHLKGFCGYRGVLITSITTFETQLDHDRSRLHSPPRARVLKQGNAAAREIRRRSRSATRVSGASVLSL